MTSSIIQLEGLFQALGDRTRIRLLNLMAAGEVCVCFFVETLGETQTKVSRHLAYLRRSGLVVARRDGKWMHYKLERPASPAAAAIFDAVIATFETDRELQRDRAMFLKACCSTRLPDILKRAPKPVLNL